MSYDNFITKVSGNAKGDIFMFTLSTCIWCKKTKKLLSELGVAYKYVDVDLVEGEAREEVVANLRSRNPETSFPTIVMDGNKVILGFQETEIRNYVKNR